MTLSLRTASLADLPAIAALDRATHGESWSSATVEQVVTGPNFRQIVIESAAGVPHRRPHSALAAGIVAHGVAWRDGTVGRIANIAVDANHRGQRLAHRLLADLLAWLCVDADVRSLQLEVRADNHAALALYQRHGFAPVGVERSFYGRNRVTPAGATPQSVDAIVMVVPDVQDPTWREAVGLDTPEGLSQQPGAA